MPSQMKKKSLLLKLRRMAYNTKLRRVAYNIKCCSIKNIPNNTFVYMSYYINMIIGSVFITLTMISPGRTHWRCILLIRMLKSVEQ